MIRFFCHTDRDGARSELGRRYAETFVALHMDLRILPVEFQQMDGNPRWAPLQRYFTTPHRNSYVNVVCSHPFWWFRYYTIGVRNVLITDEHPDRLGNEIPASAKQAAGVKREVIQGRVIEFETFDMPKDPPRASEVALHYDAIVVPTDDLAAAWRGAGARQVVVIGLDLAERARDLEEVLGLAS